MNEMENIYVAYNLDMLVQSMRMREPVKVVGTRLDTANPYSDVVINIINEIQAEDGSGCNYNLTFAGGERLFVKLNKCHLVLWARERVFLAVEDMINIIEE